MTLPVPFPTGHSVLDANALSAVLAERYRFDGAPRCQLMYRGMNDIFIVHDAAGRSALRAWRTGFRTDADVAYELELLAFLVGRSFPAAASIPAKDGSAFFVVAAPEGPRQVALYRWAGGQKFGARPTADVARLMGDWFARMHIMARDFVPSVGRATNRPTAYLANLPALQELVFDRPEDCRFYAQLAQRLTARMTDLGGADLPRGATHGDFHFNNVHVDDEGRVTFLDFDNAGEDYWLADVMCYVWANGYGGFDGIYADAFLAGYEQQRPFTADEKRLMPLFHFAKEFRLLSGMARNVNTVGHAPLRFRDLDWFAHSLRRQAGELGLV